MSHPLIPKITELATPIAEELALELVSVVIQTNRNPPTLRIDVRNPAQETGLDDCERMSRALSEVLDKSDVFSGGKYTLEVSSPGTSRALLNDREFTAFQGFAVKVKTYRPFKDQKQWQGRLQGRDEQAVYLNHKGRAIAIPRDLISKVQLDDSGS
ncbi:MAG: ribosome maturation factor RimP [Cyanobacteria bacterium P01_H01_bin.15]